MQDLTLSLEKIKNRTLCLKAVSLYAYCFPPDALKSKSAAKDYEGDCQEFWQKVKATGTFDLLSPEEHQFATKTVTRITQKDLIKFTWRIEALQVLLWALWLIDSLPPYDQLADHLIFDISSEKILAAHSLRGNIEEMREAAEMWHWRSRTLEFFEKGQDMHEIVKTAAEASLANGFISEIVDDDFAVSGIAYRNLSEENWHTIRSVTMERHFAFNWLCGYSDEDSWDETPTDT